MEVFLLDCFFQLELENGGEALGLLNLGEMAAPPVPVPIGARAAGGTLDTAAAAAAERSRAPAGPGGGGDAGVPAEGGPGAGAEEEEAGRRGGGGGGGFLGRRRVEEAEGAGRDPRRIGHRHLRASPSFSARARFDRSSGRFV